ncbi:MAG: hypothetical protein GX295_05350 [Syntrophomonadaceae bacterium]|nr:hypothetical protein [Syntrophomonadaceae bacterium]
MKIKSRLFLSLILVVLMLGLNLPLPAAASTPPIPDEVEVTWEVIITSNYAWSSETTDDEGKIINRYNGNDSFNMQSTGTTKLQRVGVNEDGHPYLSPQPGRKDYNVNGYGGGTEKFWETYTITPWVPGKGWGNPKDFEQTKVEDWQYHMPETGHEIDPEDDAVSWFVIIDPESDKEPVRYQMLFEPFFFIQHDTLSDYIDASGQYQTKWQNFEGSHSESGELMDAPCRGSLHIAGNVWFHRQLNHPSGGVIEGELEFSDNKFRDKGSVQHTSIDGDHGRAEITVKYEINREPSVKAIQPNQVLGRYQYQDDEHYQPATDFVAGKDTVIQAFLSDEIKIDQVNNLELDIYCNDNLVTTLKNPKKDRDNNAGIFIPGDQSKCDWGAGVYKFVARIGYSEKTLYALFEEQRDIRILAVPLKANYGGKIVEPGGNWIDGDSMLRKLYPLADHNVKWIPHPVMVDASQPSANLMDYNGLIAIRWILQCLQPDKFVETPYDAIIGFVADPIPIIKNNKVVGYTLGQGKKPIATVALVDDYPTTVAHEIAHFYDVGDEYDGGIGRFNMLVNPPPFGFQGEDLFTFEPVTSDADYVKPAPVGSGSLISKNLHPFDPRKNKLLPDSISFMGTDAPESKYWISPAIWRHLYHSLGSLGGAANAKTANLT